MNNIVVMGFVSLFTDISTEMAYPLIAMYLTMLGSSPAIIGVIEGIAESLASLLKVFSGYVADRHRNKKKLTMLGYGISMLGKLFLILSTSWLWVLASRIVDRFGKGVRTAPRDVLIAEAAKEGQKGRAFGLHRAMDSIGAFVGVLIAFILVSNFKGNFKTVFIISIIPAILGVLCIFLVKEKRGGIKTAQPPSFKWNLLDGRLKAFLVLAFIFTLGNSSNQFLLLRAYKMGFDSRTVILLYLAYNLIYALLSYPLGRLSDKIGRKHLLISGYILYGLVYLGFGLAVRQYQVWILFAVYGLYIAATEGVEKAFVSDISPAELRGTVLGLHATLVGIGLFPSSLIAGLLWDAFGPTAPFYFGGVMGLIAAVYLFILFLAKPEAR